MRHTLGLAVVLVAIWLANSGIYTPLVLGLGVLSVILVLWIAHRMDVVDHESIPLYLTPRLPAYYGWLLWQIILSNLDVARRICSGNITPTVADIPIRNLSDMSTVIYANSITLTPGTVVMDLDDERIRVHALSHEGITALLSGEMERRIRQLEGS